MRIRKRNRILKRIVLGFALVALVVPGAAKARVDEGKSQSSAGQNVYLRSSDGIEIARLQPRSTLREGDLIEQVRVSPREVSTPQAVASPGFDWSDAAIGAGVLFGLVLLGGAAFLGTRHSGRTQTA
jgi:hypothetical protein